MAMSSAGHRHWNGSLADHGRGQERGQTAQDRTARPANRRGHRRAEKASRRNERDPARDVLTAGWSRPALKVDVFGWRYRVALFVLPTSLTASVVNVVLSWTRRSNGPL